MSLSNQNKTRMAQIKPLESGHDLSDAYSKQNP
jgi:hypothetical protein